MLGLWGQRRPGGACGIQTAAEETHQGWPAPGGDSPPGSLEIEKDITCKSMELHEKAGGKEFVSVCNLIEELCTTGNINVCSSKAFEYWYLQRTCQRNVELKVVAELEGGEVGDQKGC